MRWSARSTGGYVELRGRLDSQELIRHSRPTTYKLLQPRNTFQGRLEWRWIEDGSVESLREWIDD